MGSTAILILGESGHGKSTSIESLDPKETFIINVAKKQLPFKGYKSKYKTFHPKDSPEGNLYEKAKASEIALCLDFVNKNRLDIKTIVIDDFIYMTTFEFFNRIHEKGYDKFNDIGNNMRVIGCKASELRDDLLVIILTHPDESVDINGKRKITTKSVGKMVEEKLTFQGLFSIVLYAQARPKESGTGMDFGFSTATDGITPAKTPRGMFKDEFIPNDLQLVRNAVIEYLK